MRLPLLIYLLCMMVMPQDFQMPRPPAELKGVPARAGWLVEHYWDLADMDALSRAHADAEAEASVLEQSFVNYLSLFPLTESDSLCAASVNALMLAADPVSAAVPDSDSGQDGGRILEALSSLADKYLFDLDSPMADDEKYLLFIDASLLCKGISATRRDLLCYRKNVLMNNRVGTLVEDFSFEAPDGRLIDFSDIPGQRLLLLFDISCQDCLEMVKALEASPEDGVTVVAVAVNATRKDFRKFAASLPSGWVCGFDSTHTVNGSAFALRHLPELMRIAPDGTVLGKHLSRPE